MIWRSRLGWLVRVGEEQYFLLHLKGYVMERYEPSSFVHGEQTYWVDYYVKRAELVSRTAVGKRWGMCVGRTVLVDLLVPDLSYSTRMHLRSFSPSSPVQLMLDDLDSGKLPRETEPELHLLMREAEAAMEAPPPAPPRVEAPMLPEVRRAMDRLGAERDELCGSLVRTFQLLSQDANHVYAMVALARASLLLLEERNVPAIDETWMPVQSQFAHRVAAFVDQLDKRGAREAANAMETCAALLGYRDGFPVA